MRHLRHYLPLLDALGTEGTSDTESELDEETGLVTYWRKDLLAYSEQVRTAKDRIDRYIRFDGHPFDEFLLTELQTKTTVRVSCRSCEENKACASQYG